MVFFIYGAAWNPASGEQLNAEKEPGKEWAVVATLPSAACTKTMAGGTELVQLAAK